MRPDEVTAQPMLASDAMSITRSYRRHSWGARLDRSGPDPWWWIGWVHQTPDRDRTRRRTWAVWLDIEDGRVGLRFQRIFGFDDDD